MTEFKAEWLEHQRKRWMRPDAHAWIRHDAHRFMPPGSPIYVGRDVVKYFWPDPQAAQPPQADDRKYSPDQPRVPGGNPAGGQWTSGADSQASQDRLEQPLTTAPDQPSRSDLSQLQNITNDPVISSRIDEAWNASNPLSTSPREHGFWIARNEITGELFTRPFASRGFADSITPGPTPSDAVAFFHTHPNRPEVGFVPGPSPADRNFSARVGLPGLIRSHSGMYYFGPPFRLRRSR